MGQIDPAFLRRFDYVLELKNPGRAYREGVFKKVLRDLPVRPEWISQAAETDYLVPAILERAARVVGHLNESDPETVEHSLEHILENNLRVMGKTSWIDKHSRAPVVYDPSLVNADLDLAGLAGGLARKGSGRLCLYGPPGTGKTEFARHVSERLGKTLLVKRGSDILSKWIGETEANIAAMFREAEAEDAVLLLDEADSFLQERADAQQTWQVTQVNELLVQIEAFNGLFIACTNLMGRLDAAAMRRFDLKVCFKFLKPDQAWAFFLKVLEEHGEHPPGDPSRLQRMLSRLDNLSIGDFATVLRKLRLLNDRISTETLLQALQAECAVKPGSRARPIGFTAAL